MKSKIVLLAKGSLLIIVSIISTISRGQDIQFSQFYNAPLYQNPAFAGSTHQMRFTAHQRLQWPALDAKYITSQASFDTYSNKYNSGFGIMFSRDQQGSNKIASTDLALIYAYELHLSRSLVFRPGLQLSFVSRALNYGLTLPENFTDDGYQGGMFLDGGANKKYVDISSGGILYSNSLWLGFSAHHLNTPNQTFIGGASSLPVKYALTGGYKIHYKKQKYHNTIYGNDVKEYTITPTFHYKSQGKSDQLDLGVYGIYENLLVGVWYRGLPIIKYYNQNDKTVRNNSEALIFQAGWKFNQLSFTYSYDFTISKLTRAGTGGAHEFNVTWLYRKHKKHKPMKRLPCPNFNH